jgi:hypothetical protein
VTLAPVLIVIQPVATFGTLCNSRLLGRADSAESGTLDRRLVLLQRVVYGATLSIDPDTLEPLVTALVETVQAGGRQSIQVRMHNDHHC